MDRLFATLAWAVAAFISTNLDDLLLLASLFLNGEFSPGSIVFGQFIGMSVLVLASLAGALLAMTIPGECLTLLGVVPLILGLKRCWKLWTEREARQDCLSKEFIGINQFQRSRSHGAVWTVTILTIANGGDNLSVYIPLFATAHALIPAYSLVFTLLTGVWCLLGYLLTQLPVFRGQIKKYGRLVIPVILVGIGLKVLTGTHLIWENK